jgi:hypothetical protein
MTHQNDFSTIVHNISRSNFFWPNLTRIIATQTFCVASVEHPKMQ